MFQKLIKNIHAIIPNLSGRTDVDLGNLLRKYIDIVLEEVRCEYEESQTKFLNTPIERRPLEILIANEKLDWFIQLNKELTFRDIKDYLMDHIGKMKLMFEKQNSNQFEFYLELEKDFENEKLIKEIFIQGE